MQIPPLAGLDSIKCRHRKHLCIGLSIAIASAPPRHCCDHSV